MPSTDPDVISRNLFRFETKTIFIFSVWLAFINLLSTIFISLIYYKKIPHPDIYPVLQPVSIASIAITSINIIVLICGTIYWIRHRRRVDHFNNLYHLILNENDPHPPEPPTISSSFLDDDLPV